MGNCVVREAIKLPQYVAMTIKQVKRKQEVRNLAGLLTGSTSTPETESEMS